MTNTKKKHDEESKDLEESEDVVEPVDEEEVPKKDIEQKKITIKDSWNPKTDIGKKVKEGLITDIDEIINKGNRILEPEIIDALIPDLETDLLLIGQSKGKFGGGARRVFKQTQKKTREGNKPNFATMAVVGNRNGYVGVGYGKAKETVPAREKAIRNAKLNIIKIRRGCGSWECGCDGPHTIPFEVTGKCGSTEIKLMPAPRGKGLIAEKECSKILDLAGVKDVWSKAKGQTKTKTNFIIACFMALKKTVSTKIPETKLNQAGIISGKIPHDLKESIADEE